MSRHMVIVGAGEAGTRAALALREEGFDGDITLVGAEPHLPYERPPLSKEGMLAEIFAAKAITGSAQLAEKHIDFRPGTQVTGLDPAARRLDLADGALPYDRLLLATGATPRRLPGLDGPRIAYLRTLDDARRIRDALGPNLRLAIIGGGFIGLELAASARGKGAQVIVIETLQRLLSRAVPERLAARLQARHETAGVEFLFAGKIAAIADGEACMRIGMENGRTIEADLVLVGIGAVPNVALAEAAGLAIGNGIAVDDRLCTGNAAIFAAGDCCSFPLPIYGGRRVRLESWRSAQEQGGLAARNMLGADEPLASVPWFWSDQYDLGLQIAGLGDEGTEVVHRDLGQDAGVLFHLAADGRLVAASGLGPGNSVAKDIRLAEKLILAGTKPPPEDLANPATKLKSLL